LDSKQDNFIKRKGERENACMHVNKYKNNNSLRKNFLKAPFLFISPQFIKILTTMQIMSRVSCLTRKKYLEYV